VTIENKSVAGRSIQTWLYEKNVSSNAISDTNKDCALTGTTYSDNWNAMLDAGTGMKAGDYFSSNLVSMTAVPAHGMSAKLYLKRTSRRWPRPPVTEEPRRSF